MELTAYDDVPYSSHPYPQAHPDRLATIATLCGMNPAPVEHCRVLELGCGAGGNLIPIAFDLKHSEFVGLDLAALPIAEGQELIEALGLDNINLTQLDLMALGGDFGQFDYIIAHGLYSWVPEPVQDQVLAICRDHLAEQGVAYVSYNTYPGCHLRQITRQMMRFHTKDIADPRERISQSRALVRWVAEAQSQASGYATVLREIAERIDRHTDGSVYHDDLGERNAPVYFHEFAKHAAEHGLQFLSEADYFESEGYYEFAPAVRQQLEAMAASNPLAKEQYLDFLKGRSFRQTLLCHNRVALDRKVKAERINRLYIKSSARPVSATPDIKSRSVEEFRGKKEASASTDLPLAKAALLRLGQIYPRAIRFDELLRGAHELLGGDDDSGDGSQTLAEVMLRTYGADMIELKAHEPTFSVAAGRLPLASPLARLQSQRCDTVTTLLHESIRIEDNLALQLLMLLDGTREREELISELSKMIEASRDSQPGLMSSSEKETLLAALPQQLEQKLSELGKLGLLLA